MALILVSVGAMSAFAQVDSQPEMDAQPEPGMTQDAPAGQATPLNDDDPVDTFFDK